MAQFELMSKIQTSGFQLSIDDAGGLIVTPASKLNDEQRLFIRTNKKRLIEEVLQNARELTQVEKWLRDIGETDQEIIDEVLGQCERVPEARGYYLKRSAEPSR